MKLYTDILKVSMDGIQMEINKRVGFLTRMHMQVINKPQGNLNNVRLITNAVNYIRQIKRLEIIKEELKTITMEEPIDKEQLLMKKVKAMRDAQNNYFRNRTPENLAKSKQLEKEVDELINPTSQLPLIK